MKKILLWMLLGMLVVVGCSSPQMTATLTATPEVQAVLPTITRTVGTPIDRWVELFQRTPHPWSTPLPPPYVTNLDATYVKLDPNPATPFPCRRCPDYAVEGGIWKLSLDRGIFRIYYTVNGWRSLGSYEVSGEKITLFNDPNCPDVIGSYRWSLDDGALTFREVEDSCAIHLRAANLTKQPWLSCTPPNVEAAVSDHWPKPPGCEF